MRSTSCLLFLGLCLTSNAGAQGTNVVRRTLSLRECIALSLQHNLDLRIERFDPQIAEYRLRASYGAYDPVFSLFAKRNYLDMPARVNPDNLHQIVFIDPDTGQPIYDTYIGTQNRYEQGINSAGGGLSGRLPSGLEYDLSVRGDYRDVTAFPLPGQSLPYSQTNDNYANVALTLRQPLLKDMWIDSQRLDIQLAKKDLKISEVEFRARMMTNVTDVMIAYYDLIYAREAVRVQRKALELAQRLVSDSRRRVEAGDLAPLNVRLAESQVETVQANITVAEQLRVERQNVLKMLLSDRLEDWMNVEIDPAETLIATETTLDRQSSWLAALANRPDLEELRLELEKRNILVRYTRNQLYPSLDLIGGLGVQAYGANAGRAWTTVRDGQHSFYSVGFMLSMPLSRTAARNNHKASKAAQEQATLRLQRQEQKAMLRVDTGIKAVQSAFSRVQSTRKARSYAEEALAAEEKKFQTGASTSFIVQEYQRNLTAAQTAEIQALADYYKAIATLHLEEGTTLISNHVDVDVR